MYNLNYSLSHALNEYGKLIDNYSSFFTIVIAMIVLGIVFFANAESGWNNLKITIVIEVLCMFFTIYYFGLDIVNHFDSALNGDFLNNICFFFLNANVSLIIIGSVFSSSSLEFISKVILSILYVIILGNLIFALFITYSIGQDIFITLGNIAPMILVGNVISIVAYAILILLLVTNRFCKQLDKKKHLLYM